MLILREQTQRFKRQPVAAGIPPEQRAGSLPSPKLLRCLNYNEL
jgi:hypothetical protein